VKQVAGVRLTSDTLNVNAEAGTAQIEKDSRGRRKAAAIANTNNASEILTNSSKVGHAERSVRTPPRRS
jgi:hypothetical protein